MAKYNIPNKALSVQPPEVLPSGIYPLRILFKDDVESKEKHNPMVKIQLEVIGHDNTDDIFYYLMIPFEGCDKYTSRKFKGFCQDWGIEPADFDSDDLVGAEADCSLGIEDTEDYGRRNIYVPTKDFSN